MRGAEPPRRASAIRDVGSALIGGALVCTGAALPWLSLFAGLQTYSGLAGLYGRLLFASGALVVACGGVMLVRRDRLLPLVVGAIGVAQALFAAWLLVGLRTTLRMLGMHAMLVARPGPGLFVALAGAVVVTWSVPSAVRRRSAPALPHTAGCGCARPQLRSRKPSASSTIP